MDADELEPEDNSEGSNFTKAHPMFGEILIHVDFKL